ncbi:MAG: hypothetical protein N2688_16170, partial [Burkholderiaceae bacterium]|nr:hypothetical protein [Burkholderiaceae bacterium]
MNEAAHRHRFTLGLEARRAPRTGICQRLQELALTRGAREKPGSSARVAGRKPARIGGAQQSNVA